MVLKIILVFAAVATVDWLWARYIQQASDGDALRAAFSAVWLYVLGAYVVTQYVHDKRMLIPAALGAFIGTYFGAKRGKRIKTATIQPSDVGPGVQSDIPECYIEIGEHCYTRDEYYRYFA